MSAEAEPETPMPEPAQPELVTVADFEAIGFEAPVRDMPVADAHQFYAVFERAFVSARDANDETGQRIYRLLAHLTSMMLRLTGETNIWAPLVSWADGNRTAIADDFRGKQTEVLSQIAPRIANLALRARLADIAWSNNRRDGAAAKLAIDTYCDIAASLLKGELQTAYGLPATREAFSALKRAMNLATYTTKRAKRPERIGQVFEELYAIAREKQEIGTATDCVELALSFGLMQPEFAAAGLEAIANATPTGTVPWAVRRTLAMAAELYLQQGNKEARQRCLRAAVDEILAMREHCHGSGAKASWTSDALLLLNHVEGSEELKRDLEIELSKLHKQSLKEMVTFEVDLQLADMPETIITGFSELSLSESLKQFVLLDQSRDPEKLRESALKLARETPLLAMIGGVHMDAEGRPESTSAGAPIEGAPEQSWFNRMIGEGERLHRARIVAGRIDPARGVMQARFGITERHFNIVVSHSAIVPEGQKPLLALGFARFFQGDFMSSAYLLIPQIEPFLRNLLRLNGHKPSKRRDDGTEEDLTLSGMYSKMRPELEQCLTTAIAFEIDLLFNAKPGPELRHEVAHGQFSAAQCFHQDPVYACWLILRLCCLPFLGVWDTHVAPFLNEAA